MIFGNNNLKFERDIDTAIVAATNKIFLEEGEVATFSLYFDSYNKNIFKKLESLVKECLKNGIKPKFEVSAYKVHFSIQDMEDFLRLEEQIKEKDENASVDFFETEKSQTNERKTYSLKQTLNAQKKLQEFVEKLKSKDASPLEKYLMIYNFLNQKVYKESEDLFQSRDLIGVLNSDCIVCVGYANMMEYLCKEVGIPCISQSVEMIDKDGKVSKHRNNLVYIDDPKYGVKGWYYADVCQDASGTDFRAQCYSTCLLPLSDKDKLSYKVKVEDDCECLYDSKYMDNFDAETQMLLGEKLNRAFDTLNLKDDLKRIEKTCRDIEFDEEIRNYACDTLEKMFREADIPASIYNHIKDVDSYKDLSLNSLMASIMVAKTEKKSLDEVKQNIQKLKSLYTSEIYNDTDDVYSRIKKIKEEKKVVSEYDPTFMPPDIAKEYKEAVESFDYDLANQILAKNKDKVAVIEQYMVDNDDWVNIMLAYKTEIKKRFLRDYASHQKKGTAISMETFKKALAQSYEYEDNFLSADFRVKNAIERSILAASQIMTQDASNCFAKSAFGQQMS